MTEKTISVKINMNLYDKLREFANKEGRQLSYTYLKALEKGIDVLNQNTIKSEELPIDPFA